MSETTAVMTAEQFLALPDDGVERMLIGGRLWERPLTVRGRWQSWLSAQLSHVLSRWLLRQPPPRGAVHSGEAGFRLRPDSIVGIDVAYITAEIAARLSVQTSLIDGAPTLAVEILSPSDKWEEVVAKVNDLLQAGTPLVWLADPNFKTVVVYQPTAEPEMYSGDDVLTGETHLPGFEVRASELFAW